MAEPRRLSELADAARSIIAAATDGALVVALSGGADSAAAAWLAVDSGRPVRAIHVHHGSVGSDRLARAAVEVAEALAVPVEFVEVTVPAGASYEALARQVRHDALLDRVEADEWLVMGHTRDDQVETLLMRLVRGSGLDGLAGMARDVRPYLRPLLDSTRSEAREIAALAGLPWSDDPANIDRRHLRNRIRTELIPMIETTFGRGLGISLHRMADVIRQDIGVLDDLASAVGRTEEPGIVRLSLADLASVPRGVAARAVRGAIRGMIPPYPPPVRVVDVALEVAGRRTRRADIGDLSFEVAGDWLVLSLSSERG